MVVTKSSFGKAKDGQELSLYTLTNHKDMSVQITDLGATLVSITMQDKYENNTDVILGFDTPEEYYASTTYFGAVIGRNGNRIDKGQFEINGKRYQLDNNDNGNNLHSGNNGFDSRKWTVERISESSICFGLEDKDLEQGYPGNFKVTVTYTLTDENELFLHYEGISDQDTVANMTNHAYFNLAGHDSGAMLDQELWLSARAYTPVRDSRSIPTGEIAPVKGTPMDFTTAKPIGSEIDADFEQLQFTGGYDHNFVLQEEKGTVMKFAEVYSPRSGICLEAFTDLPGVQFYAGNFISDCPGKKGAIYQKRQGFCLETQYFPNSINQEGFAKPLLKAGEKYDTTTCYKFSVR